MRTIGHFSDTRDSLCVALMHPFAQQLPIIFAVLFGIASGTKYFKLHF